MDSASLQRAIGAGLGAARRKRGLTQEQLGILAEVNPTQLAHYEAGNRKPDIDILHKLAQALATDIDTLMKEGAMILLASSGNSPHNLSDKTSKNGAR